MKLAKKLLLCPRGKRCFEDCRPGRPRCWAMRKCNPKWETCLCDAYHHPHRKGGGLCGNQERMNLLIYGPPPDDEIPF